MTPGCSSAKRNPLKKFSDAITFRRKQYASKILRALISSRLPSVISDDCWGGEFYQYLGSPYLTPLVGVYVVPPGFISIAESPREVLSQPLEFIESEKPFPVAKIGDIVLCFMHDDNSEEVQSKWERRLTRVRWDNLLIKIDFGKTGYTDQSMQQWNQIQPAHCLALLQKPNSDVHNGVYIDNWIDNGSKIFKRSIEHFCLFQLVFNNQISKKRHWLDWYYKSFVA